MRNKITKIHKTLNKVINRIRKSQFFIRISFFFKFIYFNWKLITLQYCSGFCHRHESAMGVHVFPILNPPSHVPPHPIPLGHPSVPALSTLSHASNLHWWFVSHMKIYMFQCDSLRSSTLTFSHRGWKTILYICFSFAVSHTGLSLPSL